MISIVVPIYNAEKYLADCLDSLVAQSDHDIEILCVDDGSTDQTIDILNSYSERYPFLRVVNQHNQGPSAARNRGIDYDINRNIYNAIPTLKLQDIVNFEQQNMARKPYRYIILGDEKELDMESLGKIGPIRRVTTEEIFGY